MKFRASIILSLVLVLQLTLPAAAQNEPTAEHTAAARDLLAATKADKLFNNVLPIIMRQQAKLIKKLRPATSSKALRRFEELFVKEAQTDVQLLMDQIAKVYAGLLSRQDIADLAKFYRTPLGQKLIQVQPQVAQASMRIGAIWGQSAGKKIAERVRVQLKKEGHDI